MGLLKGLFHKKPAPEKKEEEIHIRPISEMEDAQELQRSYAQVKAIEDPAIRARELLQFAEAGFSPAMLELALAREQCGETEEVFSWLSKAAEAGNYMAYYEWGIRTLEGAAALAREQGEVDERLLKAGLSQLCDAAGGGIQKAVQALTAYDHQENDGAAQVIQPILDEKLEEWAEILDENEEMPHAQFTKGLWYFYGVGYEQDLDQAREWFQKAAGQGHRDAAAMLDNPLLEDF